MYRLRGARVAIYLGFAFVATIFDIFKLIIKLNFEIPEAIWDQGELLGQGLKAHQGHLRAAQKMVGHLRPAAIGDLYNRYNKGRTSEDVFRKKRLVKT